jgi:putative methionine-R-sulfoxide reductase with GAF domain
MPELNLMKINPAGNDLEKPETLPVTDVENEVIMKIKTSIGKSDDCEKNLLKFSQKLLSHIAREKEISQGVFFIAEKNNDKPVLRYLSGYAHQLPESGDEIIEFGEGFPGQVAKDSKLVVINEIPEGYMSIESGLGKGSPVSLIVFPVNHNGSVLAVIELASFHKFTPEDEQFFEQLSPSIAEQILIHINKS